MATAPPPLAAAPVSAEMRLSYVLMHFRQAYESVPEVSIGYAEQQPTIEVTDGADGFFDGASPYPPAPNFRAWQGRSIPFFFDPEPEARLLTFHGQRVVIGADIVSAAFYLLSGWQEYFSEERDQHGRFPYSASVQSRYGFVAVPVVNYYFEVLRAAVEHVTGQPLRPRRWANDSSPFATFVSHDIDNLKSAWKAPAKAALKRGDLADFGRRLWQHLTTPDAWDNLAQVREAVAQYGARSTFFLLPEHRLGPNGTPNADYHFKRSWPRMAAAIGDAEIGLHASLGAASNGSRLKLDWLKIPVPMSGIRFHYLSWEPRITPLLLDTLGFTHDSTLGFAEHFGFRHSYCLPFQPFLFQNGGPTYVLEIPLNLMDATLHHPRYLQLAPDEVLPAVQPMLEEIERFGGVLGLLWHNENFDPANQLNGPAQFHTIMEYLRSRRTAFVTGMELVAQFPLVNYQPPSFTPPKFWA